MTREASVFAAYAAVLFAGACSVYSSNLVDGSTEPVIQGGSDSGTAGQSTAGKPTNGGTSSEPPGGGGEGGETEPGGSGGSSTAGGTNTGGTGNTAGAPVGGSAGSAGTAGSAGSAGTGGTPPLSPVIDDFEDNDLDLLLEQTSGYGGVWYTFHDETTGKMTPSPLECTALTAEDPEELGLYAMHITATGYTSYGSGLGVDFSAGKKPYDASQYTGIRFWAKVGDAVGTNKVHRVQISDVQTDPVGGKCDPAATAVEKEKCEDHYGKDQTFTTEWAQYSYTFAQLRQIGWGFPGDSAIKLDVSALYGLQFTAKKNLAVDLWVDQIEFY